MGIIQRLFSKKKTSVVTDTKSFSQPHIERITNEGLVMLFPECTYIKCSDIEPLIQTLFEECKDFREKCGVKDPIALNEIEEAYYQGTELKKQQLLKYAVLETTVIRDSDGDGIDSELSSWLTLEQTEITDIPESLGLQEGDKVRVYVFKED